MALVIFLLKVSQLKILKIKSVKLCMRLVTLALAARNEMLMSQ